MDAFSPAFALVKYSRQSARLSDAVIGSQLEY